MVLFPQFNISKKYLQCNSRFHSLSTFIFETTDTMHNKRAQNDELIRDEPNIFS